MSLENLFHGPNSGYILELFEKYQADPSSVDDRTRAYFDHWTPQATVEATPYLNGTPTTSQVPSVDYHKIIGAVNLVSAIRNYGHLAANIDPIDEYNPPGDYTLEAEHYGLTEADLTSLPADIVDSPATGNSKNALEVVNTLREIYSSNIGFDFGHLRVPEERKWIRNAIETRQFKPKSGPFDPVSILQRLTEVETFELFLHRIFPGKTRFSIEGLDMMVPMLDELILGAARGNVFNVLIGMAHRGRLNVLAHILRRPYEEILTQFKDFGEAGKYENRNFRGWTGDVKYHDGAYRAVDFEQDDIIDMVIQMAPNPSHLEHVNPVVVGMARAAGANVDEPGRPRFDLSVTLPILIHGDAAFMGQGIVAETLNMHRLRGYRVGGTIHIIANNQLGFTTNHWMSRSTRYASDLAKAFKIPIVHVNADDPEACIEVARLAIAYRQKFQEDFLIDLVGYRRYGHNEGDEPRFTQPWVYEKIDKHPTVRQLWAKKLVNDGLIDESAPENLVQTQMDKLHETYESLKIEEIAEGLEPQRDLAPAGAACALKTAVTAKKLRDLNEALIHIPSDFQANSKILRAMKRREKEFTKTNGKIMVDWATAEALALGSILADGTSIRFTGEDVERGTFSHRHALLRSTDEGKVYVPLQKIPQAKAAFEIRNSPLTENAAVGFEYGYNIQAPERLVIWEAQYGDFINGAQATIDEFLVSGYAKWEQTPSLVMLLPHGHEGAGPDHSSARPERFLQLAAKTNMRIAYPTTAAQYFHLLRRQAGLLTTDPLPLIVMSPKSLLRHPLTASKLTEFSAGKWQPVIDDAKAKKVPNQIRRLLLCSGKVYIDLLAVQGKQEKLEAAIVRVEQLYSLPEEEIRNVIASYPNLEEVVWMQEEPANMGAWSFMRPHIERILDNQLSLRYIGRPRRASPAEGSSTWHKRNQAALTEFAFKFE
ncbi:MAG: 2-oxoglutarate dehydrogenase E1 component [Chloroflexota bacterium]